MASEGDSIVNGLEFIEFERNLNGLIDLVIQKRKLEKNIAGAMADIYLEMRKQVQKVRKEPEWVWLGKFNIYEEGRIAFSRYRIYDAKTGVYDKELPVPIEHPIIDDKHYKWSTTRNMYVSKAKYDLANKVWAKEEEEIPEPIKPKLVEKKPDWRVLIACEDGYRVIKGYDTRYANRLGDEHKEPILKAKVNWIPGNYIIKGINLIAICHQRYDIDRKVFEDTEQPVNDFLNRINKA